MDPDSVLEEIRSRLNSTEIEPDSLEELVEGLCDWLSAGGHLPREWDRAVVEPIHTSQHHLKYYRNPRTRMLSRDAKEGFDEVCFLDESAF